MSTLSATRATLIGLALLATPLGGETHPQGQVPSLRRGPDSSALRLDVERGGQKLERVVVIR